MPAEFIPLGNLQSTRNRLRHILKDISEVCLVESNGQIQIFLINPQRIAQIPVSDRAAFVAAYDRVMAQVLQHAGITEYMDTVFQGTWLSPEVIEEIYQTVEQRVSEYEMRLGHRYLDLLEAAWLQVLIANGGLSTVPPECGEY
ncbi:hypothetical protein D2Q93_06210 [Alicyclobacillaceae bacterium I2511]|nr:hypothetical protein D2Q93_06210 [Alicyclobacillaceae bacterium I2511]